MNGPTEACLPRETVRPELSPLVSISQVILLHLPLRIHRLRSQAGRAAVGRDVEPEGQLAPECGTQPPPGHARRRRAFNYSSLCGVTRGYYWDECTSLAGARVLGMPHLHKEEFQVLQDLIKREEV